MRCAALWQVSYSSKAPTFDAPGVRASKLVDGSCMANELTLGQTEDKRLCERRFRELQSDGTNSLSSVSDPTTTFSSRTCLDFAWCPRIPRSPLWSQPGPGPSSWRPYQDSRRPTQPSRLERCPYLCRPECLLPDWSSLFLERSQPEYLSRKLSLRVRERLRSWVLGRSCLLAGGQLWLLVRERLRSRVFKWS